MLFRSGSCFVQVSVGDQNDNIPKFISLSNVTSVPEDALPGTTVVTIKVCIFRGKEGEERKKRVEKEGGKVGGREEGREGVK